MRDIIGVLDKDVFCSYCGKTIPKLTRCNVFEFLGKVDYYCMDCVETLGLDYSNLELELERKEKNVS